MRRLFVATSFWLLSMQALAAAFQAITFENGNKLYSDLTAPNEEQRLFAMGFIIGVADAGGGGEFVVVGWQYCVPTQSTMGQIRDVVRQFLEAHPEKRHMAAAGLVGEALQGAFPCAPK